MSVRPGWLGSCGLDDEALTVLASAGKEASRACAQAWSDSRKPGRFWASDSTAR